MDIKKMMEQGKTADEIQEAVKKEIADTQAELDRRAAVQANLTETRTSAVTAVIDYLMALDVIKTQPTDEQIARYVKDLEDAEPVLKHDLPHWRITHRTVRDHWPLVWDLWPW